MARAIKTARTTATTTLTAPIRSWPRQPALANGTRLSVPIRFGSSSGARTVPQEQDESDQGKKDRDYRYEHYLPAGHRHQYQQRAPTPSGGSSVPDAIKPSHWPHSPPLKEGQLVPERSAPLGRFRAGPR